MKNIIYFKTLIAELGIIEEGGNITNIIFNPPKIETLNIKSSIVEEETPVLNNAIAQINEYFSKKRKYFDLPIKLNGTQFQLSIWQKLNSIPYGNTKAYKQIASEIGNPKASRAVGNANNKNPIPILIPCHRVIGANGTLTGYRGGINVKKALLNLENSYI